MAEEVQRLSNLDTLYQNNERRMTKKEDWIMPEWMQPFREHFTNTGGNTVEELMSWKGTMQTNMPMALLQCCMVAQVGLLMRLHDQKLV